MRHPFRRPDNAAENALSSYWDNLVLAESSGEVLPVNVDPDLASTVRQLERFAAKAIPQADFADRMLDDLLGKHREEVVMHVARPGAQSRTFTQPPLSPLPFPVVRRGLGYIGAAAVMLLLIGAIAFVLSRQSDPDSPPPVLPAAVQEEGATPVSSPAGTPAVMVNPDSITSPWQWDLPLINNNDRSVDQYLRVAVSPAGEVFAVDTVDATIHLLDAGGEETGTWGEIGTGPRQFNFFTQSYLQSYGGDIDFDAEGNIYVFDSLNDRIQKYSPDRQFLKEWSADPSEESAIDYFPLGAVDPVNEKVYVVAQLHPLVQVFDLEGNLLTSWGEYGGKEGQFRSPSDVAVAPDGTVWISDKDISRIQHFDSDGNYLGMLGGERGDEPGQFNQVTGLFIDDAYNIYVADFGNGRIQVVRPDGTPLLAFNLIGGTDSIAGPYSLWVDDDGSLYVADSRDDRMLKLRLPPLT